MSNRRVSSTVKRRVHENGCERAENCFKSDNILRGFGLIRGNSCASKLALVKRKCTRNGMEKICAQK